MCEQNEMNFKGVGEATVLRYKKYSHWRIKQIFLEYYGIELRPYFMWYKAMRYRTCQQFLLVDMQTNNVIGYERGYTLEELRYFLSKEDFPLHDDKPISEKRKAQRRATRNLNAVRFLEIVDKIQVQEETQ